MAARKPWRFYVYELLCDGVPVYVGKGSGRRLKSQMTKQQCDGREVARFRRERDAYAFEVERIAEFQPAWNRHPGGNGSKAAPARYRKTAWEKTCEAFEKEYGAHAGLRVLAARMLLRYDLSAYLEPSKVEEIRQVAYGCGT